MLTRKLESGY